MKTLQTALAIALIAATTSTMAATAVEANEVIVIANASMPATASTVVSTVATAADTVAVKEAVVAQATASQTNTQTKIEAARKIIAEKSLTVNDIAVIKIAETQNGVVAKVAEVTADVAEKTEQVKQDLAEEKAKVVATTQQAKEAVEIATYVATEQAAAVKQVEKVCPKKAACLKKKAELDAAEAVEKKGFFSWFKKKAA